MPRRSARGRGVRLHGPVPVEMVLGDVEDHAHVRPAARRPVQLEARQLGREHLHAGLGQQHVGHRQPDVPARARRHARLEADRLEHRGGGGLSVGTGHREPRAAGAEQLGGVGAPRQLDVAPHADPGVGRGDQQRRVGAPPRAGHDQVDTDPVDRSARGGQEFGGAVEIDALARDTVRQRLPQACDRLGSRVGDHGLGAQRVEDAYSARPGHTRAQDQHPQPVQRPDVRPRPLGRRGGLGHIGHVGHPAELASQSP